VPQKRHGADNKCGMSFHVLVFATCDSSDYQTVFYVKEENVQ
jgi:hypothetical protein